MIENFRLLILLLILGSSFPLGMLRADDGAFRETVQPFLAKHCFDCHGPTKQQGDRRFDGLATDFERDEHLESWQDILDMLNLGEMPPKDRPRPSPQDV